VHLAAQSGRTTVTQGAITYQLRRLRLHGLIERLPNSFRYRNLTLTPSDIR
jgi:DNA-binding MarR family transcriptional regulator